MKKSAKVSLATGGLLLVAFLMNLGVASACTYNCVKVTGGGPFCRQCQDTGAYTGITCQNSGACGCFLTQNTCSAKAQASADLSAVDTVDSVNACPTPTKSDTGLPAALLQ
jgi:hypothetical protein